MSFKITAESDLWESRGTFTLVQSVTYMLFICKAKTAFDRRHCGLARHFKTDPTETIALCFGYPKIPCLRADGSCIPVQMNRPIVTTIWLRPSFSRCHSQTFSTVVEIVIKNDAFFRQFSRCHTIIDFSTLMCQTLEGAQHLMAYKGCDHVLVYLVIFLVQCLYFYTVICLCQFYICCSIFYRN
jgi:hypothetical protein